MYSLRLIGPKVGLVFLLVGFSVAAAPVRAESAVPGCFLLLPENEPCPDCPGISSCLCLFKGANCPGNEVICFGRPKVNDGPALITEPPFPCYRIQDCQSQNGGVCNPLTNSCVTAGNPVEIMGTTRQYTFELCPSA